MLSSCLAEWQAMQALPSNIRKSSARRLLGKPYAQKIALIARASMRQWQAGGSLTSSSPAGTQSLQVLPLKGLLSAIVMASWTGSSASTSAIEGSGSPSTIPQDVNKCSILPCIMQRPARVSTFLHQPSLCAAGNAEAAGQVTGMIHNMKQDASRHRYKFLPPPTPEGFWDMGFGDSLDTRCQK